MPKPSYILVALLLGLSNGGCGGPDGADIESANGDPLPMEPGFSESGSTPATLVQELTSTGEFSWSQGNPATPMGSTTDRVCYLTRMTGRFEGWGESIHAFTSRGSWYLGGSSMQADVAASSRCAYVSSSLYTVEYSWHQSQSYPTYMGSASGRVCFLTRISGKFKGWGEWVHAYVSGGNWYLSGGSQQQDVSARARCVLVNSYTGEYLWSQYQSHATFMGSTAGRSCALTYVKGNFRGWGEFVHIFDSGGSWYLGGGSYQQDVAARARCF